MISVISEADGLTFVSEYDILILLSSADYKFTNVTSPSGASDRKVVWVQVPSPAPSIDKFR